MNNVSSDLANLRQRELASLLSQQNELAARLDAVDPSSSSSSSPNLVERLTLLEQALSNLTSSQSSSGSTPDDSSTPGGGGAAANPSPANLRRLGRRVNIILLKLIDSS